MADIKMRPKRSFSPAPTPTSRSERPYSQRSTRTRSNRTASTNTSPPTPASPAAFHFHYSKPSIASTTETYSTAQTSVSSHSPHPSEPDEWFAKFRNDPDLAVDETDDCPDLATLAAVSNIPIYDGSGECRPFGSLYDPKEALHQRQFVIFIRHFYCGACQAYLQAFTKSISEQEYFRIPIPTSIAVIGCGEPDLIRQYKKFTSCPYPIYADPSRQIFKKLGMNKTLNLGSQRPEYMKDISTMQWLNGQMTQIRDSVRDPEGIRKRDALRGGNPFQIGGEFLFEDGEVVWCHRMRHMRNHAEVGLVRRLLELDD